MPMLAAGLILFLGLHLLPAVPGMRMAIAGRLGEARYKGAFSLLSFIGLALIIAGYALSAPGARLFAPSLAAIAIAPYAMLLCFILLAAANLRGHIRHMLKHPMLFGIAIWASVHLLANGDTRGTLLFASFLLFALLDLMSVVAARGDRALRASARHDLFAVVAGVIAALGVMALHRFCSGLRWSRGAARTRSPGRVSRSRRSCIDRLTLPRTGASACVARMIAQATRESRRNRRRQKTEKGEHTMAKKGSSDGVYRVIDVIGTSSISWEDAAKRAVSTASKSLRDLRIAEVVEARHEGRGREGRRVPRARAAVVQVRGLTGGGPDRSRALVLAVRSARVRAALRAAPRFAAGPLVFAARRAAAERAPAVRFPAADLACRASALVEAAVRPSRRSAAVKARERRREALGALPPAAVSCATSRALLRHLAARALEASRPHVGPSTARWRSPAGSIARRAFRSRI